MRRVYEDCRCNVSSNSCLLVSREIGKNDCVIVDALEAMAHVMGQANAAL